MSTYKVPQDVEADDKLVGPFSFRQFVYLIIVALAGAGAWGLSQLFLPLFLIPTPIILFFGALALPLRKDQPMETYLAAMVSFFLKPHLRKWEPDGIESLIEITVPKTVEIDRVKDITQSEAQRRFSYLAEVVDSQGWAVRGTTAPGSAMTTDAYMDAQSAEDMLDETNYASQTVVEKLNQSSDDRRQSILDRMQTNASTDLPTDNHAMPTIPTAENITPVTYPDQQPVSQPIISQNIPEPVQTTSEKAPSAGIINLANTSDLSVATIANQANRINARQDMNEEVIISLR